MTAVARTKQHTEDDCCFTNKNQKQHEEEGEDTGVRPVGGK